MSLTEWPRPFGGITMQYVAVSRELLVDVLQFMAEGCYREHDHNIAVSFGNNSIFTTELGIECIQRYFGQEDEPT